MRLLVKVALCIFFLSSSMAVTLESNWNDSYQKELSFYCSEGDTLCMDLCNDSKVCKVPEQTCHNCIGTDITITYIFNYMGKAYTNTGVDALGGDIIDLLKSGEFVTFSSRSIYNHVDSYNSLSLRKNFRKLCSDGTMYPVVMFNKDIKSKKVSDVRFVFCESGAYEMRFSNDLILNLEEDKINSLY